MSTDQTADEARVEVRELSSRQRRVLGALLEKAFTTPEYYPMTLKALTAACNQKSNRSPLVNYDEDVVEETLDQLRELGLAAIIHSDSGRTDRYRHYMRRAYSFTEPQLAILTELLLRGRQTPGELRGRVSRMVPIDSLATLRSELTGLLKDGYLQASGSLERRGIEVDHNLYCDSENQKMPTVSVPELSTAPAAASQDSSVRSAAPLASSELTELIAQNQSLTAEVENLKSELTLLEQRLSSLENQLGV